MANTFSSSNNLAELESQRNTQIPTRGLIRRPQSHSAVMPQNGQNSITNGILALHAMNSEFFNELCEKVKFHTGGKLDVHLFIAACVGLNAARVTVPAIMTMIFDQVKTNVSSSIAAHPNDFHLHRGLLQLARENATAARKAWYDFSGQHESLTTYGQVEPLPGSVQKVFRHDGTLFILEKPEAKPPTSVDDLILGNGASPPAIVVRCFGHSNAPICELLDYVREQQFDSKMLSLQKMAPGSKDVHTVCNKRHFNAVDLDPQSKERLITDATYYFGDGSRESYLRTGMPYRRGYLSPRPIEGANETSTNAAQVSGRIEEDEFFDAADLS